ncbi:MAG: glycosyltransferase family 4 protein [Calditrichaeota bacterium]|nr:glycosyltransferase family 4 protein [Calditrichota bacterium]
MEKHRTRPLKILYISQYFPPEVGATQSRAFDMAYYLSERGHQVTVIGEFPNHPRGIVPREYRNKFWERVKLENFAVCRTWVYASPEKSFLKRMLFYVSFALSSLVAGLFIRGSFDIVYATSPPLFVGVSGYVLSRLKNAKFVFEVRDLWPDSAVALGELNNARFIRWARTLEEFFYRKAQKIVVVTAGIREALLRRKLSPQKICLVKNGTNTRYFRNVGAGVKEQLGLQNKFVVGYFGILGLAQGMEFLCEVIEKMKSYEDIHFIFVGEGPKKQTVEALKSQKKLTNLTLLGEVPREKIAGYISACDVSLVPLRKKELFTGALPSKMFDTMACERPVILSVEGEARHVLQESGAGIFVEPENAGQMISAILHLKSDPRMREEMGKNGLRFVEKKFSRKALAGELEACLLELF